MLEKIILETKDIQTDSITRLLDLSDTLMKSKPELTERTEELCLIDSAKISLEQSRLIHDLIINISEAIKGGK